MDAQLKDLWDKTLNILRGELTEVSYNTWIKSCEPLSVSNDTIRLGVPNDFTKEIIESGFSSQCY